MANAIAVQEKSGPMMLMERALENNVSADALEKLMALQERHEANEARKQFFAAMHDFQGIKPRLTRSSKVSFSTSKGTTAYNFCALPDIEAALRDPLGKVGLSYRFENFRSDSEIGVSCIVSHVSGHSERTSMSAPADNSGNKNSIQGIGSTTTYLQRYTIISAFGLTTADDDDDGQTGGGDMPYLMLLRHNAAVRDNLETIIAVKQAIATNDFYDVAMYMDNMPDDIKNALWLAPTKGGIFTTKEISIFKTNEYASARADYFAEKQDKGAA